MPQINVGDLVRVVCSKPVDSCMGRHTNDLLDKIVPISSIIGLKEGIVYLVYYGNTSWAWLFGHQLDLVYTHD